jgi:hypothetical protein
MREVIIALWCDVHMLAEEKVASTSTNVITIDGSAPRQLDLCDEHRQQLLGDLAEYLVKYGTRPEVKKRSYTKSAKKGTAPEPESAFESASVGEIPVKRVPRQLVCPECKATLRSGGGAASHIKKNHGEEVLAAWQALTPAQRAAIR